MQLLNAKARRLAKREADRVKPSSPAPSSKQAEILHPTKADENLPPPVLNAKERRLAKRQAEREQELEPEAEVEAEVEGMTKKKRKRRHKKSDKPFKARKIHLTVFVGQLPFDCTEEDLQAHFHEATEMKTDDSNEDHDAFESQKSSKLKHQEKSKHPEDEMTHKKPLDIRMLRDKVTKKFKGMAFLEVADDAALGAVLSRHHTLLKGRRINVELTVSGGGTQSELRTKRLLELREKQKLKQVEKTQALLAKYVADPDKNISQDDVDERSLDFLSWFDIETAKKALDEYCTFVNESVSCRKRYFMGILKRFRPTDGVEEERPARRGGRGGMSRGGRGGRGRGDGGRGSRGRGSRGRGARGGGMPRGGF